VALARFVERQLGRPSRLTARLLNLANAGINEQAVELLEVSPEHRVLDVGFGGGVALARLADRAAFVAGIDHSRPAVTAALERFRREVDGGRMQIEAASVDAIPFEDASFHGSLSVHTIYFWEEPEHGLGEILRVLKPRGRLVLATDTRGAPRAIAKHGFRSYTEEDQADLLRSAGFGEVRFERRKASLFAVAAKPA
jgi:arsenite methyltransferase